MSAETLLRTPLYDRHVALGARMVPFAGWEMPIQYGGIVAEHRAVRTAAGLFDLSHMGEFYFSGARAGAALDRLVSSDIAGLEVGQARYGLLCNERGTIVDDVIVYRLAPEHYQQAGVSRPASTGRAELGSYMMVVNASNIAKDAAHVRAHLPPDVEFADGSMATSLIAIQGPKAADILSRLAPAVRDIAPFGVARVEVGGVGVTVARTGYTGEDGFEIFLPNADAPRTWDTLLATGKVGGLAPIGLGARDTLRLESRYSLYGNEIDETTDPIEAGLAWTCKLDKEFVGRDAIARAKEAGPKRRIAGLVIEGGVARHGYPVTSGGAPVGRVTSGTFGPTVGKNIALAYVPAELSKVGTAVAVRIRDRDVPATVVKTPFYRRGTK